LLTLCTTDIVFNRVCVLTPLQLR